jgi:hypothetical protein
LFVGVRERVSCTSRVVVFIIYELAIGDKIVCAL